MSGRCQVGAYARSGSHYIEPAEALVERRGYLIDLVEPAQVERHARCASARCADRVVGRLEVLGAPRQKDNLRAFRGVACRHRGAETTRRAGDKSRPSCETSRYTDSESSDSWVETLPAS